MAATAYQLENHHHHHHHHHHHRQEPGSHGGGGGGGRGRFNTQNPSFAPENTAVVALKHNPGFSNCWTTEEQSVLEAGLANYASDTNVVRYAKIAIQLPCKTVRDVALRCKWMTYKESRRRKEDFTITRKYREKKDNFALPSTRSSYLATPSIVYTGPTPTDNNNAVLYQAIGGTSGLLLEENFRAFSQIAENLTAHQLKENINLFWQSRENIFKILNNLEEMPNTLRPMPELPIQLNEELANSILPWASNQKLS